MVNMIPERKEDIMTAAQQLEQRGEERGLEEGIEKGVDKGMLQGIREGIWREKIRIAEHMRYKLHLDRKTVAQATGLSEEELQ
jgi:recombination-promoting nuclease RpnB